MRLLEDQYKYAWDVTSLYPIVSCRVAIDGVLCMWNHILIISLVSVLFYSPQILCQV